MKKSTVRFLSAMGSILDIYPAVAVPTKHEGPSKDAFALRRDVINISSDFRKALNEYESATGRELPRTTSAIIAR